MIKKIKYSFEHISIAKQLLRWTLLTIPVAFIAGSLVALFLWLLDKVTTCCDGNMAGFVCSCPLAGVLIYFAYKYIGKNAEAGNNSSSMKFMSRATVYLARMSLLVLGTTIITHLFGGSAGRGRHGGTNGRQHGRAHRPLAQS